MQGLPSSQSTVVPWQLPSTQVSTSVQAFSSSQVAGAGRWTQPVAGSQVSSVQGLSSSQAADESACSQPVRLLQESVVQAFPSSQEFSCPAQTPLEQLSSMVHGLSSVHAFVLKILEHPDSGAQLFVVQGFWSSQPALISTT